MQPQVLDINGFLGYNSTDREDLLLAGLLPDGSNGYFEGGKLIKRAGRSKFNSTELPGGSTNLVLNPGFETAGSPFANWTKQEFATGTVIDNTSDPYAGSHCLELKTLAMWDEATEISDYINVTESKNYYLYSYLKNLSGTEGLDQAQSTTTSSFLTVYGLLQIGMSFTPSVSGNLKKIDLYLYKVTGAESLTVEIRTNYASRPSSTLLASETVVDTTTASWITTTFSSPPLLIAGTKYWIVLKSSTSAGATPHMWCYAGSAYGNGGYSYSTDGGVHWYIESPTTDMCFKTYMIEGINLVIRCYDSSSNLLGTAMDLKFVPSTSWTKYQYTIHPSTETGEDYYFKANTTKIKIVLRQLQVNAGAANNLVDNLFLAASAINGLHAYYKANGTKYLLSTNAAGYLYWLNSSGIATQLSASLVTNKDFSFENFTPQDIVVIFAEGQTPQKWNGTTLSALGTTPPAANYCIAHLRRLFAANTSSYPLRLYYSALANADDWTTTNDAGYIDVPSRKRNDKITGLAELAGDLVVFCRNSIFILRGESPDDFYIFPINETFGCCAPKSISRGLNEIYFLSDSGVYKFLGEALEDISYEIKTKLDAISRDTIVASCAAFYKDTYYLNLPNYTVLSYSSINKTWNLPYINQSIACYARHRPQEEEFLYGGSGESGYVYKMLDGLSDDGTSISFDMYTSYLAPAGSDLFKRFRKMAIETNQNDNVTLTVTRNYDWGRSSTNYSQALSSTGSETRLKNRKDISGQARVIQLRLNEISSQSVEIYGISLFFDLMKLRKVV